ncbi:hypothetical protein BC937DRAFT_90049 [Endogone sp. FLAS-F59071]|nr:hypothetical protein BC937DRAFT_90049 [Endogone sp. FLAS-F59071]|eukprot:RUS22193.1 hypothetical protein BC937DRAFT_90049 [Endogone sp. FLAS-F59071]
MKGSRSADMFLLVAVILFAFFVSVQADDHVERDFPVGEFIFHYYANHDLDSTDHSISKLVVVIHGIKRNADTYFTIMENAAHAAGITDTTAIIAPHFEISDSDSKVLIYTKDGWLQGDADTNSHHQYYSFTVIDILLQKARLTFPNLAQIIIAGHSAGGQFVQRYGAMTTVGSTEALHIPVKYLALNPGTYMYLDDQRLSLSAFETINSTCGGDDCNISAADFVPSYWNASCPAYNMGKYGTDNPTGYLASVGVSTVISHFPQRNFTYLLGDLDFLDNADLDTSCEAEAEGWYRKQRGLVWKQYVHLVKKLPSMMQSFAIVPHCGHNDTCMFYSTEFLVELTW